LIFLSWCAEIMSFLDGKASIDGIRESLGMIDINL
jgi:hypothetical protein